MQSHIIPINVLLWCKPIVKIKFAMYHTAQQCHPVLNCKQCRVLTSLLLTLSLKPENSSALLLRHFIGITSLRAMVLVVVAFVNHGHCLLCHLLLKRRVFKRNQT